jgi:transposase
MDITEKHYEMLLGLDSSWSVEKVDLNIEELRLDIYIDHVDNGAVCPECGETRSLYDHSPERTWRHLDTMQFETRIHCKPPRVKCEKHGIITACTPWAGKYSRFTLLFEDFAVKVLTASRSISAAGNLLRLNWEQVQCVMKRAVNRGIERRDNEEIPWIGMDEKSFRKGHNYISVMSDIEGSRVLDVVEGRDGKVAEELINKGLDAHQREMVCGVAIDMSAPYISAIKKNLPHADIVHDKFHISKHINDAVNKTRVKEHRAMLKKKDDRLKGTKFLWLKGLEQLDDDSMNQIENMKKAGLNVAKAWYVKEMFKTFWDRRDASFARSYFDFWYREAFATKLPEIQAVARMLKKHLENIITYFDCYITNAFSEGINSMIQAIKANARGFRNFENYRTNILFFCGKLRLAP